MSGCAPNQDRLPASWWVCRTTPCKVPVLSQKPMPSLSYSRLSLISAISEVIGRMWVGVQCGHAQGCTTVAPRVQTLPGELPAGKLREGCIKTWDNPAFAHCCLISHSNVVLKTTNIIYSGSCESGVLAGFRYPFQHEEPQQLVFG